MLADRMLTTIVFFLDETFEELSYDMCTTAQEATEQLAATIKLENHSTFALFDCRRVSGCLHWHVLQNQYSILSCL